MDGSEADCIFCNIVQGNASADLVYEDEFVVGFWDAHPARPIHILIVPRTHIATLNDISKDDHILSHIGRAAARIAADFGVADSGYRLLINVNREGGQVIFHLHAHLMAGRKRGSI